jgi:hypothetical protein
MKSYLSISAQCRLPFNNLSANQWYCGFLPKVMRHFTHGGIFNLNLTRLLVPILVMMVSATCADQRLIQIKKYYGVWLDDSEYKEMLNSRSPFASREFLYHQALLTLGDTCWIHGYSDAMEYTPTMTTDSTIRLDCMGNPEYSFSLRILNDSTMICTTPNRFDTTKSIYRRFAFSDDFPPCDVQADPFLYCISAKYFRGSKKVTPINNPGASFVIDFVTACKVQNFPKYTDYGIWAGGTEGSPKGDIIAFDSAGVVHGYFNFEISSDSIYLYNYAPPNSVSTTELCDSLDIDLVRGKLMYVLVPK